MLNDFVYSLVKEGINLVEARMPRFSEDLREFCLIESPSYYKPGLDAMARAIASHLDSLGLQSSLLEAPTGGAAVLGTLLGDRADTPPVLLLCHHDTVHPLGVAASRVYVEGQKFSGPGSVDMKAGVLIALYALELLVQRGYRDFSKVLLLSVPDEEVNARTHLDFIRQLCREEQPLVLVLEGGRSIGNVVTNRKGGTNYHLTAEGLAAHAGSAPEKGKNAVLELAHQIVQFCSLNRWREGLTINAGPIRGGTQPNVVSDFAEVVFDTRYMRLEDHEDTEARWRKMMQEQLVPGVKLTLTQEPNSMPPMVETEKSLHMAHLVQMISEDVLAVPFDPEARGGCSDGCHTAMEGCPTIDGLGAIGGNAHHAEEFIQLESIPQRVALLAGLIAALNSPE
jgi:glutamate carboxypeptidase